MKILTWNCNGAFRKKFQFLEPMGADLLVIQECEDPRSTMDSNYKAWANNYFWIGENAKRGLGIFANSNISIIKLNWDCSISYEKIRTKTLRYFLPCEINYGEFILVGTWCHGADSPTFGYIGQLWQYLQKHKGKLGKAIIAGDFNSNPIWDTWDRWWNHTDVVRELKELEIESGYHHYFKDVPGRESRPTFYLQRNKEKKYHIDYIFGSTCLLEKLKGIEVGQSDAWLDKSDHMPVWCEF